MLLGRVLGAWAMAGSVFWVGGVANATSGHKVLTSNWTMTERHMGNITIAANNVTLDCQGNEVHSSSNAVVNCLGNKKCAVAAVGRSNVKVKNCYVVGGNYFETGVLFDGASSSTIQGTLVSSARRYGYYIVNSSQTTLTNNQATKIRPDTTTVDQGWSYWLDNVNGLTGSTLSASGASWAEGMLVRDSNGVNLKNLDITTTQTTGPAYGIMVIGGADISLGRDASAISRVEGFFNGIEIESMRATVSGFSSHRNFNGLIVYGLTHDSTIQGNVLTENESCDLLRVIDPTNNYIGNTIGTFCTWNLAARGVGG